PDIAVFDEGLFTIAGADAEKGQIAAAGEGFEVAAGMSDTVHFVEGIGEVGDAGGGESGDSGLRTTVGERAGRITEGNFLKSNRRSFDFLRCASVAQDDTAILQELSGPEHP
ncbi:MAG: hypothetical protein ACRD3S_02295, partial [Terracidiphilus sp.]